MSSGLPIEARMAAAALAADATGRPQVWQKVIPSGIFVPQLGQKFMTIPSSFFLFSIVSTGRAASCGWALSNL
jgi:hypothetical protein